MSDKRKQWKRLETSETLVLDAKIAPYEQVARGFLMEAGGMATATDDRVRNRWPELEL